MIDSHLLLNISMFKKHKILDRVCIESTLRWFRQIWTCILKSGCFCVFVPSSGLDEHNIKCTIHPPLYPTLIRPTFSLDRSKSRRWPVLVVTKSWGVCIHELEPSVTEDRWLWLLCVYGCFCLQVCWWRTVTGLTCGWETPEGSTSSPASSVRASSAALAVMLCSERRSYQ